MVIVATVSAIIGILQFLIKSPYYYNILHARYLDPEYVLYYPILLSRNRASGLAWSDIDLSYNLLPVFMFVLSSIILKTFDSKYSLFFKICGVIVGIGLLLTLTRSAYLGVIIGGLFLSYFIRTRKVIKFSLIVFAILILALSIESKFGINFLISRMTNWHEAYISLFGRIGLVMAGIEIIRKNPIFGIGLDVSKFIDISSNLSISANFPNVIGVHSIHNHFIFILTSLGIPVFLLFLLLYKIVVSKLLQLSRNSRDLFVKHFAISIITILLAYTVHIWFHNFGPLGEPLFWIFIGLIPVLERLEEKA